MSQPKDWSRCKIKHELDKKGYNITELSKMCGFKSNSISVALTKPWPKIERLIADIIGVNPSDIWPSRYKNLKTNLCSYSNEKQPKLQVKNGTRNLHGLKENQKVA